MIFNIIRYRFITFLLMFIILIFITGCINIYDSSSKETNDKSNGLNQEIKPETQTSGLKEFSGNINGVVYSLEMSNATYYIGTETDLNIFMDSSNPTNILKLWLNVFTKNPLSLDERYNERLNFFNEEKSKTQRGEQGLLGFNAVTNVEKIVFNGKQAVKTTISYEITSGQIEQPQFEAIYIPEVCPNKEVIISCNLHSLCQRIYDSIKLSCL